MKYAITISADGWSQPATRRALVEQHDQRQQREREPRERHHALDEEVRAVLHRGRDARAQLDRERAAGSGSSAHRLEAAHARAPHAQRDATRDRPPTRPARAISSASSRAGEVLRHQLDRRAEHVTERQPARRCRRSAGTRAHELHRQEVAREQRPHAEVEVEDRRTPASIQNASAADREHDAERDQPRERDRRQRAARAAAASVVSALAPELSSSTSAIGSATSRAERQRRRWLAAYATNGWIGRSRRIDSDADADLLGDLPRDPVPVRLRTISAAEVVGDEVGGVVAPRNGASSATLVHSAEHHERHRRRQHPDHELGAVGDGLGDADAQQRRERAQRARWRRSHAASLACGCRRLAPCRTARASRPRAAGPRSRGRRPCSVAEQVADDARELALGDPQRDALAVAREHRAELRELGVGVDRRRRA